MKLRLAICTALISTVLFAQAPGGFGGWRGANANTPSTPPTPAQLAARQLQLAASFLGLDSAQTSALTGNSTLTGLLATEASTLQSDAATLKSDYSMLATELISAPSSTPAELNTIEGLINTDLQLRVTAAGQIISALQALGGSLALSSQQTAKLPALVGILTGGGGAAGFHGGRH